MIKTNFRTLAIALAFALLTATGAATGHAQTQAGVFFDDFLADNSGMPGDNIRGRDEVTPTVQGFLLWTVAAGGSVDLVGGTPNVPGAADPALGGRFVDLGGSTNSPGFFQTADEFIFQPNVSYTLRVRYLSTAAFLATAVDPTTNSARMTLGGRTFTLTTSSPTFEQFSVDLVFPTLTTTRLAFQDLGPNDNSGVGIDMVMVNPTVPEPGSVTLMAGALTVAGAGAWAHRRRNAR